MLRTIICWILVLFGGWGVRADRTSEFASSLYEHQRDNALRLLQAPAEPTQATPKIWALLVAGSNTWGNYRHQADVCHSYQVLHRHGIPDEQIVVMMYDDLANNPENPTPGIVINHPEGQDVYTGVPHDYVKDDVTPENFLKVLKGDAAGMAGIGSGKVIASGPNDNVFVYFADHGAPGIIAFPNDELAVDDLNNAINSMHQNNQYQKMVFYVEACESGSMFNDTLSKNINVYATTAANPDESSYACYFDDTRETYLGDVYSVMWLEDSDEEVLTQETLRSQFQIVKKETNTSHVMQYGDLTISNMHVSEFQGSAVPRNITHPPKVPLDAVPSEDVPLEILRHKLRKAEALRDTEAVFKLQKSIMKMNRNRLFLTRKALQIVAFARGLSTSPISLIHSRLPLINHQCYNQARKYFKEECFNLSQNPYALRVLYLLVNLCEDGIPVATLKKAMDEACTHPPVYGIV